jgi:hypothetical protein
MKFGHTTAGLLIAKLHASSRQNSVARAPQEYGRLVRTIYLSRYLADEELRRRVRRQLNKGESLHALRRDLFFAHQGQVRRRHLDDQVDQALCLTLVTNAVVLWNTTYLGDALDALRADGYRIAAEDAAHLTPAQHDHINFSTAPTPSTSKQSSVAMDTARFAHRPPEHRQPDGGRDQIRSAAKGIRTKSPIFANAGRTSPTRTLSSPQIIYHLGPDIPIPPIHTAGTFANGRVWVLLGQLLTPPHTEKRSPRQQRTREPARLASSSGAAVQRLQAPQRSELRKCV